MVDLVFSSCQLNLLSAGLAVTTSWREKRRITCAPKGQPQIQQEKRILLPIYVELQQVATAAKPGQRAHQQFQALAAALAEQQADLQLEDHTSSPDQVVQQQEVMQSHLQLLLNSQYLRTGGSAMQYSSRAHFINSVAGSAEHYVITILQTYDSLHTCILYHRDLTT